MDVQDGFTSPVRDTNLVKNHSSFASAATDFRYDTVNFVRMLLRDLEFHDLYSSLHEA